MITSNNKSFLIKYGPDHIRDTHIANSAYGDEKKSIFLSPLLTDKQQDSLAAKGPDNIRKIVERTPHVKDSIVDSFMKSENDHWDSKPESILKNDNASTYALTAAVNHPDFKGSDIYDALYHKNINSWHIHDIINKHGSNTIERIARFSMNEPEKFHARIDDSHIKALINSAKKEDSYDGYHIDASDLRRIIRVKYDPEAEHPHNGEPVPHDIMNHLLRHPSSEIQRIGSSHHESLTPEHIDMIIKGNSPISIGNAMKSKYFNDKHFNYLVEKTKKEPVDAKRWALTGKIRDHLEKDHDQHEVRRKLKELGVKDD